MTSPIISVCVVSASFSRVKFVCRAIDSVLRQSVSLEFIELIVACHSQVASFLRARYSDAPISFVELPGLESLHRARTLGYEGASGRYVLFLDDDDFLATDALPKLLEVVIADETVDIVDSPKRLWESRSNVPGGLLSAGTTLPSGSVSFDSILDRGLLAGLSLTLAGRLVRRALLSRSFSHEWDFVHEDVLEFLLLLSEPVNVVCLPFEVYVYRRGHPSLTSVRSEEKLKALFFGAGVACRELSKSPGVAFNAEFDKVFEEFVKKMDPVRRVLGLPGPAFRAKVNLAFLAGLGRDINLAGEPSDYLVKLRPPDTRPQSVVGKFVIVAFAKYHLMSAAAMIRCSQFPQLWAVIDLTGVENDQRVAAVRKELAQFFCAPGLLDDSSDLLSALALITFNDHHSRIRGAIQVLVANKVTVVAIIEGLYDLTGEMRYGKPITLSPYQSSDLVVAPSQFAGNWVAEERLLSMANPYLWSVRQEEGRSHQSDDYVLINFNFTYGIRMQDAQLFLDRAISVSVAAGFEPVISVHPAARVPSSYKRFVSSDQIEDLVERAAVVVSRFSTVLLLARTLGVPAIYFNPGGEQNAVTAGTWIDLPVIRQDEDLQSHLESIRESGSISPIEFRRGGGNFLATFGGDLLNFGSEFRVFEERLAEEVKSETPLSSIERRVEQSQTSRPLPGRRAELIIRRLFPGLYLALKSNRRMRAAVRLLRANV